MRDDSFDLARRIFRSPDDNIASLRSRYPQGLHFVVGDTHGECATLRDLMDKIAFDPRRDRVYFVGDYDGYDTAKLLKYIAQYYTEDPLAPGFHLIRGNHERDLAWRYRLEHQPDIILLKGEHLNYYIAHAGMVRDAFDLINEDARKEPDRKVHVYGLDPRAGSEGSPLRQVVWSKNGLYSQKSFAQLWPRPEDLHRERACIIHGHTPFCMMMKGGRFTYGDDMLLWKDQRIWFAEDLQSFDIDSNVKGRHSYEDPYRGLSCICLEVLEELAAAGDGRLTVDAIGRGENFVFGVPYRSDTDPMPSGDLDALLASCPAMKTIGLGSFLTPMILGGKEEEI